MDYHFYFMQSIILYLLNIDDSNLLLICVKYTTAN